MKRSLIFRMLLVVFAGTTLFANAQTINESLVSAQSHLQDATNKMVITGKLINADNKQPITNAKINYDSFGDEICYAAIDKDGNYTLVLDKAKSGKVLRILFQIKGFNQYTLKTLKNDAQQLALDLMLTPEGSKDKSIGDARYLIDADESGKLTIKF